jgi:hypothetical protein
LNSNDHELRSIDRLRKKLSKNRTDSKESENLSVVQHRFNQIFFLTSVYVIALIFLISNIEAEANTREQLEKLATAIPLLAVVLSFFFSGQKKMNRIPNSIFVKALGAIVAIEIFYFTAVLRPYAKIPNAWSGFGRWIAVTAFVSSIIVILLYQYRRGVNLKSRFRNGLSRTLVISSTVLAVLYIPGLIQVPAGFTNFGDSTYHVLEESLAQSVGFVPYINYTPSYTSLLGWLVSLYHGIGIDGNNLFLSTLVTVNALIAWVIIKTVSLLQKSTPSIPRSMVYVFVLPVLMISGSNNGAYSLISGLATIPARLVFPIGVFLLLKKTIFETKRRSAVSLGLFVALGVTEPPGISLVAGSVAILILLALCRRSSEVRKKTKIVISVTAGALTGYLIMLRILFGRFDFDKYLMMLRAVGNAENSETYLAAMPTYGFHVVVYGCLAAGALVGFKTLGNSISMNLNEETRNLDLGSLIAAYFGLLGLVWMFQFSGASIYPFVLQFSLFWMFLTLWGLIPMLLNIFEKNQSDAAIKRMQKLQGLPFIMLAMLPFISVIKMPNPINEIRRLSGNDSAVYDRWTAIDLQNNPRGERIRAILDAYPNETIGYFGILGNSTELIFGVKNYLGVSAPEHLMFNSTSRRLGCEPLLESPPEILIVAWTEFPCPGYRLREHQLESDVDVYELIP